MVRTSAPAYAPIAAQEATRLVEFARACKGAARAVVLYPGAHPAVAGTLDRLVALTCEAHLRAPLTLTVLPDNLLIADRAAVRPDLAIVELAALLHSHGVGQITVRPGGNADAWEGFLRLLARQPHVVRDEGGIARAWKAMAGRHLDLREIDYVGALQDGGDGDSAGWDRIVVDCLDGHPPNDSAIKELLAAAGYAGSFSALVEAVDRVSDVPEGIDSRAALILRILRRIVDHVSRNEPDRREAVLRSMAAGVERMSADLLLTLAERRDDPQLVDAIVSRLSDDTIAGFVARHVSDAGTPTAQLARAFQKMAPDAEQRQRLLLRVYDDVSTSPAGATDEFCASWNELADALAIPSDPLHISPDHARALSGAGTRAVEVEEASDDPPERIEAWLDSVSTTALRSLDLALLLDLLRIDQDPGRWSTLMTPVLRVLDDLLLVGDFDAARQLVAVLVNEAADERSARRTHAVDAIDILIDSSTVRHITAHLATIDEAQFEVAKTMCVSLGEVIVVPLAEALATEDRPVTRERLTSILLAFGPVGRRAIERLKTSPQLAIRRTALYLLREFGDAGAVPAVDEILHSGEPDIQREALRSILRIGTDEAFRVLEEALIAGDPPTRDAIMQSLGGVRHERVTALFAYLLRHIDHRGPLAPVVMRAIESLGVIRDPAAVAPLQEVLYKGEWWAPRRTAALRSSAAAALARIGTADALAALDEAAARGPRGVRAAAHSHLAAARARLVGAGGSA